MKVFFFGVCALKSILEDSNSKAVIKCPLQRPPVFPVTPLVSGLRKRDT